MVQIETLQQIEAFKEFNTSQLIVIEKHIEKLEYQQGDRLFKEGDVATHLWLVTRGKVDLRFEMPDSRPTSNDQTLSKVDVQHQDPHAKLLGWSCFISPFKMRLSAYCVTESCQILRIEKKHLIGLFEQDPECGYKFLLYLITVVGYRFHQFQDHVAKHMGEDLMAGW